MGLEHQGIKGLISWFWLTINEDRDKAATEWSKTRASEVVKTEARSFQDPTLGITFHTFKSFTYYYSMYPLFHTEFESYNSP